MVHLVSAQVHSECRRVLNRELESLQRELGYAVHRLRLRGSKLRAARQRYGEAMKRLRDFTHWVCISPPGARMMYATLPEQLMVLRETDLGLDRVAKLALTLSDRGLLSLYQKHPQPEVWEYYAARSKLGIVPRQVMFGIVGSTPSPKNFDPAETNGDTEHEAYYEET